MNVDFLILGQGICGTLLSRELLLRRAAIHVIDEQRAASSSRVAAAIINPVGGRKLWRTHHMEQTLPVALSTYREMAASLNTPEPKKLPLLLLHNSEERRNYFAQRAAEEPEIFETGIEEETMKPLLDAPFGTGRIYGYYQVQAYALLQAWRNQLHQSGTLRETFFDWNDLRIQPEGIIYQDISAGKLIVCDGACARENPLFRHIKWTANKGEALILSIPGLPRETLYQQGLRLAPWRNGLWWLGTRQVWDYTDVRPSTAWRTEATHQLRTWLKLPFEVADHLAAERPATAGQQPVAQIHPQHPALAIFNGMGTRGFANAPFYAKHLAGVLTGTQ